MGDSRKLVSVVTVLFFFYTKRIISASLFIISQFSIALGRHCCMWASSTWGARASHRCGFSHCGARAQGTRAQELPLTGPRAQTQQLWVHGLSCPEHVKSAWTRDQIHVPCFGRQILNHWTTREVHLFFLDMSREHGLVNFIIHQAIHLEILPFLYMLYTSISFLKDSIEFAVNLVFYATCLWV